MQQFKPGWHPLSILQDSPKPGSGLPPLSACARFGNPNAASAKAAMPTPNFFNAARRGTGWAKALASSSNLLFMTFLSFWFSRFAVFSAAAQPKDFGLP
jgi:hypothetical protein